MVINTIEDLQLTIVDSCVRSGSRSLHVRCSFRGDGLGCVTGYRNRKVCDYERNCFQ